MLSQIPSTVLLASPDSLLIQNLRRIFSSLGLQVDVVTNGEDAVASMVLMRGQTQGSGLVLLDVRLPWVANGRLLASAHEYEVRKCCAISLIAEQVSDEWIARLREGMIDDIVPRNADATAWRTHISTMQRGHALYCELEHLREASLVEVRHDPVTGAFNRDTMLTILFRETDRVQRLHGALSVVVFDLDDFGRHNNELGQEAGDQLLTQVAKRAQRTLRTYDVLGRLGRDEFLIALPGCSTINAVLLAERLKMDVFGETFWVKNARMNVAEVRLSACFGVTSSRGRSPVIVLREAEQAVKYAKQMGPDSIRCSSDSHLSAESAGVTRLFPQVVMGGAGAPRG
jgi:two-component system cell cycle response regulator